MAKQDDWQKITLRMPSDLHRRLVDATGANSLNAEIVERLRKSLDGDDALARIEAKLDSVLGQHSITKIKAELPE